MDERFCPRCGAYWKCDCAFEAVELRQEERSLPDREKMTLPAKPGCPHDWTEALGVHVDEEMVIGEAQVLVCRLCGLYSVEEKSA